MTSGEWDLRALRALEEEEKAQFELFGEGDKLQIPPPPQLPVIDELAGIEDSLPSSPTVPLPPSILSGTLLSSSRKSSYSSPTYSSHASSSKYHHLHKRHQAASHRQRKRLPDDWEQSSAASGTSPIEPNDMMTMMMFLSSASPSEMSAPTTCGSATSLVCTTMSKADCDGGGNCMSVSSLKRSKFKCNKSKSSPPTTDIFDYELEDHIKHCSCSCNHMGYGNSMDYQTTGFGGLPDVTEHSNIRRNTIHQDSISNSESTDGTTLSKSKKFPRPKQTNRKFWLFSLSIVALLIICTAISIVVYNSYMLAPSRNSHDQRLKIVERVLREVPLIDGHNDLPWNVRKYAQSSLELLDISHDLGQESIWHRPSWSHTDIPRLKRGLVGAQIWSAFVPCEAQGLDAVQLALEQIDLIHRLAELHPKELTLATSSQQILTAHRNGMIASLIGIEGGHAIGSSLGVLRSLHSLGARYLTLTHHCDTSWAGSSSMSMDKGLNVFGKAVVKEMNRLGMLIDLSHVSDTTVKDVLEVTRAPVIFSHSVARTLCNSSRNVPDDILRAVADNGGIIMISFSSAYVSCSDVSTLQDVVDHIKYIRYIAGIQHIGIGAGYDGIDSPPKGLEDVSKYPELFAKLLEDENWSEEDIAMLAGKNFLRVFKSVENVRDYWKRAAIQPIELVQQSVKTQCTYMSS